ncbi:MAG: hypothetical protein ACI8ZB_003894 [Desulforhopalus sp.]|jgi:hypothetical protein
MNKRTLLNGIIVMLIVATTSVVTTFANSNQGGGDKQGPPPEAIKACDGKQEGDAVKFSGRNGESLSATCQTIENLLVAVPEGHKRQ